MLVKCADLINSHPIEVSLIDEDQQRLTPNHLLIGHAQSRQVSQVIFTEGDDKDTKRTRYVLELSNQWWKAWFTRCFPTLFAFRGWVKKVRNLEVGDIVLVETKLKIGKGSYCMVRVIETHPDANGLVRKVTLEARPQGGPLGLPYVSKDLEKFNMAVQ